MSEAHKRWHAVLADMKAIGKDSINHQQRFQYRSIDDIKNHLKPLLAKHGVFYYLSRTESWKVDQRPTKNGGVQYSSQVIQWYTVAASDGSSFDVCVPSESTDFGDKATQKAMTFAEKTFLTQALCISTEDMVDPDALTPMETLAPNWSALFTQAESGGPEKLRQFLDWAKTQGHAPKGMFEHGEKVLAQMTVKEINNEQSSTGDSGANPLAEAGQSGA